MIRVDVNGVMMAKCNFCEKLLNATKGTSSLRKHVLKCLDDHQEATHSTNASFDPIVGKSKVAKMIIMHELPLRFVKYTGFQEMMGYCQPRFELMSRNTLKSEIFKLYNMEKDKTLKLLDNIESKVAITMDMWTSSTKMGYMVVTVHFIDKSWLSAITVDNCSTNDCMIEKIKNKFGDALVLGGRLFHMRCCAQILNLVVRDGLKVIADGIEKIRDSIWFRECSKSIEN
ncbi:hypothetical protein EZV62_005009 [Acer yangbiense]|uniref:BED-type domain-containing protein n=1 Tax=Acer yangbiense TaxID=1000413 RepID=A0A5C7IML9_9ROSI|nr:hypothetical protein EZV62_005009 [Acer yangbiense]